MKEAIEEAGRAVAHDLERFLTTLGTIATAAPLLGLFGTVIGMIEIFGSQSPGGHQPAAARARHLDRALQHRLRHRHRDPVADLLPPLQEQGRRLRGGDGAGGLEADRHRARRARGLPDRSPQRGAMNFQRGRYKEEPEINLMPLIDVMMVILIFLMITTTYSKYTELQINLPTADAEKQLERPGEVERAGEREGPVRDQQGAGRVRQHRAARRRAAPRRRRPARADRRSSAPTPPPPTSR